MENSAQAKVLVVDDEPSVLKAVEALLAKKGHAVVALDSPIAATQRLAQEDFDVALLDIKMPQLSGLELLSAVKHRRPEVEVIMMTGHATVETALAAIKAGAYDYLTKPFEDVEMVARSVSKAAERKMLFDRNRQLETQLREREGAPGDGLVGNSAAIREVTRMIEAVAYSATTVLVTGESGTGKELVARALHARSPRKAHPFVALNCGALTETLLESELFGHVKGAFTGATGRKEGRFELADGGTLFLDEIGDISPALQIKLLRVLQQKEFERVGGTQTLKVDVRLVAATNRDLAAEVKGGKFREDLYYRLNVVAVTLPPLRQRKGDIPALVSHFIDKYGKAYGKEIRGLAPGTLNALLSHDWPGNVRELENVVERAVVLSKGTDLTADDLPPTLRGPRPRERAPGALIPGATLYEIEREAILRTLEMVGGSTSRAAEILGISVRKIQYRLKEYAAGGRDARRGGDLDKSEATE